MIRELFERYVLRKPIWEERYFIPIVISMAVLSMLISLAIGLQQSVWFDEAYSIMLAKQSIGQLLHLTSLDTHPPLYYLLLKGWASLFGWSEFALRSLSVLALGGAVAFAGLTVRRMFNARAALMILPFVAFAPFLLRYGFEVRMYALASFIGIAATYVLISALETKDKDKKWKMFSLYSVLLALGVYTLYYIAVLWIAHVVWLFWRTRGDKQPLFKQPWALAIGGAAVLFLPWLPTFVSQLTNGALAPISQPLTMDNLTGIISFMFTYQASWQLTGLLSLIILFVIIVVTYLSVRAFSMVSAKQKNYLVLLALYGLVPIAIVALISLVRPMYVERYLAHVLIGVYLYIGAVVWLGTQKASKCLQAAGAGVFVVLLIGIMQLVQVGNYNFQRLQTPAVKEVARTVGECSRDQTVLAADPYTAIELAYYLPSCEIRFYSEWATLRGGYAPLSESPLQVKNPAEELRGSKRLIYVYYDTPQLSMPPALHRVAEQAVGPLHVDTFSAE